MYIPNHFEETRTEVLHGLMREQSLAALVTLGSAGINANHLPLLLDASVGPNGTLRGHVARANPFWRDLAAGVEALAIFQGPNAYVSPSWYPGKAAHGKAVPTWNYCVVHAYGVLRVIDDAAWVLRQASNLTNAHEAAMPTPWAVADAPADYVASLAGQIVGIEMEITRLSGKWKLSQNQPPANRSGVVQGLDLQGGAAAQAVAAQMRKLKPDGGA